MEMNVKKNR